MEKSQRQEPFVKIDLPDNQTRNFTGHVFFFRKNDSASSNPPQNYLEDNNLLVEQNNRNAAGANSKEKKHLRNCLSSIAECELPKFGFGFVSNEIESRFGADDEGDEGDEVENKDKFHWQPAVNPIGNFSRHTAQREAVPEENEQ